MRDGSMPSLALSFALTAAKHPDILFALAAAKHPNISFALTVAKHPNYQSNRTTY